MESKAEEILVRFNRFIATAATTHEKANRLSCVLNGVVYLLDVNAAGDAKSPHVATCAKLAAEKPRWEICECTKKDQAKICPQMQDNIRRAVGYLVALISRDDTGATVKIYLQGALDCLQGAASTDQPLVKLQALKTQEAKQTVLLFAELVPTEIKIPTRVTWERDPDCPQTMCYLLALMMHEYVRPALIKYIDNYLLVTNSP